MSSLRPVTLRALTVQQTDKTKRKGKTPQSTTLVPSYILCWGWGKPSGLTQSWWQSCREFHIHADFKLVFSHSWKKKESLDGKTDVPHLLISCWTSLRICSSSLEVSYSFSMSYSRQGCAHFWACSICSGVKDRSKRMPWMLNLGRSQRLDHGFGRIFTFIWWIDKNSQSFNILICCIFY